MSDVLDLEIARALAQTLNTIPGFRWQEANTVADDLVRWCKGWIHGQQIESAQDQAIWLVGELRDHWTKWHGTAAMREMFAQKYARPEPTLQEQRKKWEAEYGPAEPDWSQKLLSLRPRTGNADTDHRNAINAMCYQAIRDAIYYTEGKGQYEIEGRTDEKRHSQGFWQRAMDRLNQKHAKEVAFLRAAIRDGRLDAVPPEPEYDPKSKRPLSLTQDDFEKLNKPVAEAERARCAICGGSGRLAGDDYCTCEMGLDLRHAEGL